MFNVLALNCCGLKNKLQYPKFQELLSANDIICLVESKTDDTAKRVFSSNVIYSSSSAGLALKSPIRQIFLNFSVNSKYSFSI
jgi:hypothetical protein